MNKSSIGWWGSNMVFCIVTATRIYCSPIYLMHLLLLWFSMCSLGVHNNVSVVDVSQRCFFYFDIECVWYTQQKPTECSRFSINNWFLLSLCFHNLFYVQGVIFHYFFGEKKMKREMMWENCIFYGKLIISKQVFSEQSSITVTNTDKNYVYVSKKENKNSFLCEDQEECVSER